MPADVAAGSTTDLKVFIDTVSPDVLTGLTLSLYDPFNNLIYVQGAAMAMNNPYSYWLQFELPGTAIFLPTLPETYYTALVRATFQSGNTLASTINISTD